MINLNAVPARRAIQGARTLSEHDLRQVSGGVIEEVAMLAVFGVLLAADAGVFDAIDVGALVEQMGG